MNGKKAGEIGREEKRDVKWCRNGERIGLLKEKIKERNTRKKSEEIENSEKRRNESRD